MTDFDDEVFALPISGHYDIGYSYGSGEPLRHTPAQAMPIRTRDPRYGSTDGSSHRHARSSSPPTVLPLSFTTPRQASVSTLPLIPESGAATDVLHEDAWVQGPVYGDLGAIPTPGNEIPPPVPPKSWARSTPSSPRHPGLHKEHGSESDLSTFSNRSRQQSTPSVDTTQSSASSCSIEPDPVPAQSYSATLSARSRQQSRRSVHHTASAGHIEPDPLPSHSHPQWLSPTQSAAFAGPRPVQPIRLCRREIVDSFSGAVIFRLSDETRLKLSRQAIYQIFEPGSQAIVGTLGYATDSSDEIAAILRGQDVVLKKESPSSNRWCFTPSNATKKNASWYWMKDKLREDIVLSDAKKNGDIIARIQRDVLSFERAGLGLDIVNEICFSAMALAELARRNDAYEDCSTLSAAIAVVALGEHLAEKHIDEEAAPPKPRRKLTLTLK